MPCVRQSDQGTPGNQPLQRRIGKVIQMVRFVESLKGGGDSMSIQQSCRLMDEASGVVGVNNDEPARGTQVRESLHKSTDISQVLDDGQTRDHIIPIGNRRRQQVPTDEGEPIWVCDIRHIKSCQ